MMWSSDAGGLSVVALHEPVARPQHPAVRICGVDMTALGVASRLGGPATGKLAAGLGLLAGPLGQIALPVRSALGVQLAQRLPQPGPSVPTIHPPRRQLVTPTVSEPLALGAIGRLRISQDLRGDLHVSPFRADPAG
jgi:hypothetical protein